ncbi:hypothetical protein JCM19240_2891 [Vibrio maritimus]|uniref:Uncharacterized protein n=1 Tax=Vibrio maritimus TaxID=990268 RepID=A0A090U1C4_9VIBR|nr:hypothetical protein JCM19240_2891 [Vibrio maritimus]
MAPYGSLVGSFAGNTGAGAAIRAGVATIDGEYNRIECDMAADELPG